MEGFISYCNGLNLGNENDFKDNVSKAVSNFENLSIEERNKFDVTEFNKIQNKQLKVELFCFVKANNSMNIQTEKSALAKELLELKENATKEVADEECKDIFNPMSRVMLYYYIHEFKNINLAHRSVSAKDFYSIEFIKILFNNENEFIKKDLREKLLEEMSSKFNIVYENLNKPTVNIFKNIRQRNSSENNLSAWLVWVYAKFDYYYQTARNFALIPEELRWQALNLLLEINQNNLNITIDHIKLLPEKDQKKALENETIQNELIRSRRNNMIGRGFGIGLIIVDVATVVGLIVGGVFAITNPFVWLGAGCTLIIGAIVTGVTNSKFKSIDKLLNPKKYEPKLQEEEPLLGDSAERTSFQELGKQAIKNHKVQVEKTNNLEGQENNEPNLFG